MPNFTDQERRIVGAAMSGLYASSYQPAEEDLGAAESLTERGMLEPEPGFSTLRATPAGCTAWAEDSGDLAEERDQREIAALLAR